MQELKKGSKGEQVTKWQAFLRGLNFVVEIDGIFGDSTEDATKDFQEEFAKVEADGVVGALTYAAAMRMGFPAVESLSFPPRPAFSSPSSAAREQMFGKFGYIPKPDGTIAINLSWRNNNIVKVFIPQLIGIEGAPGDGMVYFHRAGAAQLKALFAAWQKAGLLKYLKSWAGSFVPRMVRGSKTQLSNHAFGSAFDINAAWNGLGKTPAAADQTGTVIPLVKIANEHGFFWGGHYNSRKDGMHFELAVLGMFPTAKTSAIESKAAFSESHELPSIPTGFQSPITEPVVLELNPVEKINAKIQDCFATAEKTQNKAAEILGTVERVQHQGMSAYETAIKVTSGKTTSFFLQICGMLLSALVAALGFVRENWKLIAVGLIGVVLLVITISVIFTIINHLKMKYAADPSKHNVE